MKQAELAQVHAWLQRRPSAEALKQAYPDEWDKMESMLAKALARRDPLELHRLLQPDLSSPAGKTVAQINSWRARAAIRQRMAALAIQRYSLAIATGKRRGKVRFNLFNGLIAQRLLFRRGFERKPVSLFWFRLWWPLLWQRRLLMPLIERKGIYCFYSSALIRELQALIAGRRCLEIGAGDGALAGFLRAAGTVVTATDDFSWSDKIVYPDTVIKMEARQALSQFAPQVVLCSWPPAHNNFEKQLFLTPGVELYIVLLSQHRFASGDWEAYAAQTRFAQMSRPDLARLIVPPELGARVLLFTRLAAEEAGLTPAEA